MDIYKNRIWKLGSVVAVLLVIYLASLSIKELKSIEYVGRSSGVLNTISVTGKGERVAVPDIATFSFSVTETDKEVSKAQTRATDKINAISKAMKDGGILAKDIKTTSYNIYPHYEYQSFACAMNVCPPSKSVLTGYDVSQSVEIKVRDISKAGSLFEKAGSLGVTNINGLSFSFDDPETLKAEARGDAIKDAQKKAEKLARELGVSIIRVNSFYDNQNVPVPMYGMGEMMNAKTSSVALRAPDISAGEEKITSNVTITYEIR